LRYCCDLFNYVDHWFCNLSLGLTTKATACKAIGQEWKNVPSVRECGEWTSTLPSELPLWELKFRWTLESS
jgi:hypothetical protein